MEENKKFKALTQEQLRALGYEPDFDCNHISQVLLLALFRANGYNICSFALEAQREESPVKEVELRKAILEMYHQDSKPIDYGENDKRYRIEHHDVLVNFNRLKVRGTWPSGNRKDDYVDLSDQWSTTLYRAYGDEYVEKAKAQLASDKKEHERAIRKIDKELDNLEKLQNGNGRH